MTNYTIKASLALEIELRGAKNHTAANLAVRQVLTDWAAAAGLDTEHVSLRVTGYEIQREAVTEHN